ncbi:MAG: hypothetical protein MJH11_01675 [Lentisphaeria bacterium]|nr:hypothetical protein [Lentisphaeria bacterium]
MTSKIKQPKMDYATVSPSVDLKKALVAVPESCPDGVMKALLSLIKSCHMSADALRPAREIDVTDLERHPVIAIGQLDNNPLLERLYQLRLCFFDAAYPGDGGYAVTTAANAFGLGQDVIMIGGHDESTMIHSIKAFQRVVQKSRGPIGYVHEVTCNDPVLGLHIHKNPEALCTKLKAMLKQNPTLAKEANHDATEQGMVQYLTGKGRGLEVFRDYFLHYIKLGQKLGTFPGHMLYSSFWKTIIVWDLVQCDPVFSPAQRRQLTEGFFQIMLWLHSTYPNNIEQPEGEIRHNHCTYEGISLYLAMNYFNKHHRMSPWPEVEAGVANLFEGQTRSYKINDDASSYSTQVPRHFSLWLQHQGRSDYFEEGHMRRLAETYVVTMDNMGSITTYGDAGEYSSPAPRPFQYNEWIHMAHWFDGDPELRWLMNWSPRNEGMLPKAEGKEKVLPTRLVGCRGVEEQGYFVGRYCTTDQRTDFPYSFVGVRPLILDKAPVEWVRTRALGEKRTIPKDGVFFDKLSMRPSFRPQDEYLMLEGTGAYIHGHQDANAIIRLTWKDRVWLVDCDYLRGMPEETNALKVICNGSSIDNPPLTCLETFSDLPLTGFTHTTARGYGGGDWHRKILWSKGGFFLVHDKFELYRQGDYALEQRWRVLGETQLRGQVLKADQCGESFHIAGTAESTPSLQYDTPESLARESNWSNYPYADETVTVLTRSARVQGKAGKSTSFCTVLAPQKLSEVIPHGKNAYSFKVGGQSSWAGFDLRGRVSADLSLTADALLWSKEHLAAFGVSRFELGDLKLSANKALDIEIEKDRMTLRATEAVTLRAKGKIPAGWPANGILKLEPGEYQLSSSLRLPAPPQPTEKSKKVIKKNSVDKSNKGKIILPGTITAIDGQNDLFLGMQNGKLQRLNTDCSLGWSAKLSGAITAVGLRQLDGQTLAAAISDRGEAAIYDDEGKVKLQFKGLIIDSPVTQAIPVMHNGRLCMGLTTQKSQGGNQRADGETAGLGAGQLGLVDSRGRLLWQTSPSHSSSGLLQAARREDGQDILVCGAQYHNGLWTYNTDGKKLGSPWMRMDGTCLCMTAVAVGPLSRASEPDLVFGTLGHTVIHFPLPGENSRSQKTYGRGKPFAEARMAGRIRALRIIQQGRSRKVVAVDAVGMVAHFDSKLQRTCFVDLEMPAPVATAAIAADGSICAVDETGHVARLDGDGTGKQIIKFTDAISHLAFCGKTALGNFKNGLRAL